eukprot:scaffold2115_cov171-Pinguiococcus_pyrenoidosus.AAC.3
MHHSEARDGRTLPLIPVLLGTVVGLEAGFGACFALVIDAPRTPHGLVASLIGQGAIQEFASLNRTQLGLPQVIGVEVFEVGCIFERGHKIRSQNAQLLVSDASDTILIKWIKLFT